MLTRLLPAALLALACASLGWGAELRTLSGKQVSGSLTQITDKEVVLQGEAGPVATPMSEVLLLDVQPSTSLPNGLKYAAVELTDGSMLQCSKFALKGQQAELTLAGSDQLLTVPLGIIAHVLNGAQDAATRQEWHDKFLAKRGNQDVLAIKNKEGVVNPLLGTFGPGSADGQSIEFALSNQRKFNPDLGRVHGLIFVRKPDPNAPSLLCKVYDVHRNVLVAAKVTLDQTGFRVTTVAGPTVSLPRQLVARLDYSNDKLAYLSDLEPLKVVQKSTLDRIDHYRRDKNLDDGPLRLAGQHYTKGLALHAHTELVYDLDGKFKEFKAVLGVDDMVGGDSHAVVKVEGDGRELFAGTITRKDKPRPLSLDVKGVKHLRLVVGSRGLFTLGDHVNFADAKVSK
jgi:hypothetical protein